MNAAAETQTPLRSDSSIAAAQQPVRPGTLGLFAGLALIALLTYFYGIVGLFGDPRAGLWSVAVWCWHVWIPKTNYEHAKLIPFIVGFLVWHDRDRLKTAPLGSSRWGWLFLGIGVFLFFAGVRTLQARLSLTALPFLLYGLVLYVWGRHMARVLLFPIMFLSFMVPLNFLTQATSNLQFVETRRRQRDL